MTTASRVRSLVGEVCDGDGTVVSPELIGGASSFISPKSELFFLSDLCAGVKPPALERSTLDCLCRGLLGELGLLFRGRPGPRLLEGSPCDVDF